MKRTLPPAPAASSSAADAHTALVGNPRISVAFHRGDSLGEGGSGLSIVRGRLAGTIPDRFPAQVGLLITDGANLWPNELRRLTRASGVATHGWRLRPALDQTRLKSHGLWIITATKGS